MSVKGGMMKIAIAKFGVGLRLGRLGGVLSRYCYDSCPLDWARSLLKNLGLVGVGECWQLA